MTPEKIKRGTFSSFLNKVNKIAEKYTFNQSFYDKNKCGTDPSILSTRLVRLILTVPRNRENIHDTSMTF